MKMKRVLPVVALLLCFGPMMGLEGRAQGSPGTGQDVRSVGPKGLLITYRCTPSNRPLLRQYVAGQVVPELDALKRTGVLAASKALFSRYVDTANWDLLLFLEFRSPDQMAKWTALERTSPAGFGPQGLKLVTDIATYPVDLVESKSAHVQASQPVYLIVPYDYTVSTDAYLQYLKGYVVPQTEGWMAAGPLASYKMYLGRGVAGRPWSSLLLLEYRDDEAFGKRDATVAAVRERLKTSPEWKAISDNKQSVRVEKAPIIAEELK